MLQDNQRDPFTTGSIMSNLKEEVNVWPTFIQGNQTMDLMQTTENGMFYMKTPLLYDKYILFLPAADKDKGQDYIKDKMKKDFTNEEVYELYKDFYKDEPFVKVFPSNMPVQTKWAYGTNFVEMTPTFDSRTHRLIVSSVIDNIGKGAAGQAIQNMNLIMGLPETTGLMMPPMYP